ncbi:hypothetical protein MMC30_005416 [Trapelia coarctata]|nr:hypothetical protein [Trapelia coarctata]
MASELQPHSVLSVDTTSGFKYATHYQNPSDKNKPYILFVHGFPSSAYDWRQQIPHFASQGYGIIAPDTLGYGDSSKPLDPGDYTLKAIADSIIEVVDKVAGQNSKVLGVGHDWGSAVLSRLAQFHPDRFLSYAFLAGGFSAGGAFDLDAVNAMTKKMLGFSALGYWKFFNEDDAGDVIDSHQGSFTDLLYPEDSAKWKTHVGPVGSTRPWVEANTRGPRAPYITEDEFAIHDKIFHPDNGGYTPALNYYRATVRGLNAPDEPKIAPENKTTSLPTIFIGGLDDPLIIVPAAYGATKAFASEAKIENVKAGHWLHLERPEEVNEILDRFFKEVLRSTED